VKKTERLLKYFEPAVVLRMSLNNNFVLESVFEKCTMVALPPHKKEDDATSGGPRDDDAADDGFQFLLCDRFLVRGNHLRIGNVERCDPIQNTR
jgi:hypothetical protein